MRSPTSLTSLTRRATPQPPLVGPTHHVCQHCAADPPAADLRPHGTHGEGAEMRRYIHSQPSTGAGWAARVSVSAVVEGETLPGSGKTRQAPRGASGEAGPGSASPPGKRFPGKGSKLTGREALPRPGKRFPRPKKATGSISRAGEVLPGPGSAPRTFMPASRSGSCFPASRAGEALPGVREALPRQTCASPGERGAGSYSG